MALKCESIFYQRIINLYIKMCYYLAIYRIIHLLQIEDGADYRVLISPLPPKVEKKEEKTSITISRPTTGNKSGPWSKPI